MNKITIYFITAFLAIFGVFGVYAQNPSFENDSYKKALWMTTRFYGGQRSGVGPNWLLATHEATDVASALQSNLDSFVIGQSFVKDADGDYDLTGGWFDCGDHVKFGQTEFYSAYMLLLGYSEFPSGYDDYYSFDYSGYISADDYTWEGKKGKPNGIPDILDEVKYATDYLMKCVRDKSTFYYQVGDGDKDHKHWVTASVMAILSKEDGGEFDGSRDVSKATGNVTSMASLCGAALASMARLYKPFDPDYAQKCLEKALTAYEFVNGTSKGNSAAGGFYGAKPKYVEDLVIFNAELYRTTGEAKYLQAAESNCSWMETETGYNYNYSLCYNNTADLACYLMASFGDASSYSSYAKDALEYYVNTMYKPSSEYILNVKKGDWGILRFPANQAFVYGLYSKLTNDLSSVNPYSLASIEYIMGKNTNNLSFITGFGDKSPTYVHHRNYYADDADKETGVELRPKYRQFGYLVGGSLDGSYNDVPGADYVYSEGGIDINAGLVGALGYINSILDPVNVNKFGHPTPNLGDNVSICGLSSVLLDSKVEAAGDRIFTWYKDGAQVASSSSATTYTATSAGEYICEIDSAGEWSTSGTVTILSTLPEVEWVDDIELCDPSYVTLDLTMNANVTYQWYKDNVALEDATTAEYKVTAAGTYKCEISSTGCEKVTKTVEVTSLLPVVADATSDYQGNVTMTVTSDGEYEWYDAEEGGNLLHSGFSYTTVISEDTEFFVQDAGEMSITAGPTTTSFSGTGVNWGNIAANFSTTKALKITGITVYIQSVYNPGSTTLSAELSHNGFANVYTSDAQTVSSAGYVSFTFSDPIDVSEAGSYSLTCSSGSFAISFFEKEGPAYSSYANNGNPITFTGASQGSDADYSFPGLVDWKVQTGSGCKRAVVNAIKGDGVGLEENTASICSVYPNPFDDVLYVDLSCNASCSERVTVEIVSLLGTVEKSFELPVSELSKGLDLDSLVSGIYLIRIKNGDQVAVERVVKR